jgi:hypothetical protein
MTDKIFQDYSVLVQYPDYDARDFPNQEFVWVSATSPASAGVAVQELLASEDARHNPDSPSTPDDYLVIMVIAGHHKNLLTEDV